MKKLTFLVCLASLNGIAQQAPTNNAPSGAASGTNSHQYWSRAGNTGSIGLNNILGTLWNSELYIYTNSKKTAAFTVADYLSSISNGGLT
ncbi:MAG: hypothetical protein EP305_05795, partial [Bacteroidetes bacterium]